MWEVHGDSHAVTIQWVCMGVDSVGAHTVTHKTESMFGAFGLFIE